MLASLLTLSAVIAFVLVPLAPAQLTKEKIDALPTFPVSGRVVNAKDGSAIARAKVKAEWIQLHCTPYIGIPGQPVPDCALPAQYVPRFAPVITDNSGRFRFPAIPKGLIAIRAEAKGFYDEWPIERRPDDRLGNFSLTAPIQDVELRLVPGSSLRGVVQDETGHPLSNWDVALSSAKVYGQGFTMTFHNQTVQTAADGTFAFEQISPGDYFVTTGMRPAPSDRNGEPRIYAPAHWPLSEPGLRSPRTVHLQPATVASATIHVTATRIRHVTGQFGPIPQTGTDGAGTVIAVPEYGGGTYIQDPVREKGAIDLHLPDGRYKIIVRTPDNHAQSIVETTASDASGVTVTFRDKVKVPVKINVADPPLQPVTSSSLIERATFGFELMLAGDSDREGFGLGTGIVGTALPPDPSGTASFNSQFPGSYLLVTVVQPPWYAASITSDGRDLAVEPYTITDQEHATPIDVELRGNGGSVSGVVHQGQVPAPAFVYALPTFPSTSALRTAIAHADGIYRLAGLAPGSYRILALDHEIEIPFREDISPWLNRGSPITIRVGSHEQVDLDLED